MFKSRCVCVLSICVEVVQQMIDACVCVFQCCKRKKPDKMRKDDTPQALP